jgi:hypothetical protein
MADECSPDSTPQSFTLRHAFGQDSAPNLDQERRLIENIGPQMIAPDSVTNAAAQILFLGRLAIRSSCRDTGPDDEGKFSKALQRCRFYAVNPQNSTYEASDK